MDALQALRVWNRACEFAVETYRSLEPCKDSTLRDQLTRASLSIPSNIAKGHERKSHKQFARFLRIAKGSCAELRTQLYVASELGLLNEQNSRSMISESIEISKLLQGLINHCESNKP